MNPRFFFILTVCLCIFNSFDTFGMQGQRKNRNHVPQDIHKATHMGDYQKVEQLLNAYPRLINSRNPNPEYLNSTPLHTATLKGHTNIVRLLLSRGANPNLQNTLHQTPLHVAVFKNYSDIAERLIQHNHVNHLIKDQWGNTPFVQSAFRGHLEILKLLMRSYNAESEYKQALYAAISGNQAHIVKFFICKQKIDIEEKNLAGNTFLHIAVKCRSLDVIQLLVSLGANVETKNYSHQTPLQLLAEKKNKHTTKYYESARLLLQAGASINTPNEWQVTPFTQAAFDGNLELTELFLQRIENNINDLPFDSEEQQKVLIKSLEVCKKALRTAIVSDQVEIVELLLRVTHLDVNDRDELGNTLLHRAAQYAAHEVIHLLLTRGADASAENQLGQTPANLVPIDSYYVDNAVSQEARCVQSVRLLVQASKDRKQHETETPLKTSHKIRRRKDRKKRKQLAKTRLKSIKQLDCQQIS